MAASTDDLLTADKLRNTQLGGIITALQNILPRTFGTFTLGAAATTTVLQPATQSLSVIYLMPTNAAAGTLMGSNKALYVSVRNPGVSFTVATASGAAAAGTETFSYSLVTPV